MEGPALQTVAQRTLLTLALALSLIRSVRQVRVRAHSVFR
jgi:hypothetical protein